MNQIFSAMGSSPSISSLNSKLSATIDHDLNHAAKSLPGADHMLNYKRRLRNKRYTKTGQGRKATDAARERYRHKSREKLESSQRRSVDKYYQTKKGKDALSKAKGKYHQTKQGKDVLSNCLLYTSPSPRD